MERRKIILSLVFAVVTLLGACSSKPSTDPTYVAEIDAWHARRVESLKGPNGWLNLAGLFWLKEGINSFGTDPYNNLVFPSSLGIPEAGYLMLEKGVVTQSMMPDVTVTVNGIETTGMGVVYHPDSSRQPVMERGSTKWFIIKRDTKYGVRVRDLNHPNLVNFTGVERFPVDASWKVVATWEATPGRTLPITNVLGQTTDQAAPGQLTFTLEGKEFRLDALDEGDPDELFIIFGDATNTKETYGAGRYLYIARPDSAGQVVMDFNRAQNPPCAFTEFATCPLPPRQNVMSIRVLAGEKDYHIPHL
jgi:uncharacterized protein (DUF1684 family)